MSLVPEPVHSSIDKRLDPKHPSSVPQATACLRVRAFVLQEVIIPSSSSFSPLKLNSGLYRVLYKRSLPPRIFFLGTHGNTCASQFLYTVTLFLPEFAGDRSRGCFGCLSRFAESSNLSEFPARHFTNFLVWLRIQWLCRLSQGRGILST